jgi:hypothetical protein
MGIYRFSLFVKYGLQWFWIPVSKKSQRGLGFPVTTVTGDNRSNTERNSQKKIEFQNEKYLNILKIRFGGEGSERFGQMNWGMGL